MIIEQHSDDPTKAHAYCYSTHPFVKKSSGRTSDLSNKLDSNDIPAIEVKGLGEHGSIVLHLHIRMGVTMR